MGCLIPKKSRPNRESNDHYSSQSYSWSNRDKSLLAKYIIENECNSVHIRMPGEINGEQFIIQNCNDSTICLYDFSNTVSIDDCRNCTFFIGPVIGSLILRNCQDCRIMSASQQFRSRDCKRLDLYLFSGTQPAIESCYDLVFSCFSANYNGLQEQFEKANLKIYNNKWFNVYDFSMDDAEKHWKIISSDPNKRINEKFCSIILDDSLKLSFNPLTSLVPKTDGIISFDNLKIDSNELDRIEEQFGIIIVFNQSCASMYQNDLENQVAKIIKEISLNFKELKLLITRSINSESVDLNILNEIIAEKSLKGETSKLSLIPNQLIFLLFKGNFIFDKIYEICQHLLKDRISEIKFKLILPNSNENIFDECLTLIFKDSF